MFSEKQTVCLRLIIDKFGEHFVIQTLALGMEVWKPAIVASLKEIFETEKIYERNDVPVRELEGMVQQKGFLSAPFDTKNYYPGKWDYSLK